jgi:hypothetical protein
MLPFPVSAPVHFFLLRPFCLSLLINGVGHVGYAGYNSVEDMFPKQVEAMQIAQNVPNQEVPYRLREVLERHGWALASIS